MFCMCIRKYILFLSRASYMNYKDPARSEKIAGEERAQQFSNGGRGPSKPMAENGWQKKVRQNYQNLSQL